LPFCFSNNNNKNRIIRQLLQKESGASLLLLLRIHERNDKADNAQEKKLVKMIIRTGPDGDGAVLVDSSCCIPLHPRREKHTRKAHIDVRKNKT
jgi:hypothetical protein